MTSVIPFVAQLTTQERTAWLKALQEALPEQQIILLDKMSVAQREAATVAIVANPDPTQLTQLPNLQWIQSLWAGVERLLVEIHNPNLPIVRMTDPQLAKTMAEAVLAWTLYLHRDMPRYRTQQTAKCWQQHPVSLPSERTVGLLGLGNLGKIVAATLVQQRFTVCGWSRSQTSLDNVATFCGDAGLSDILQRSHILICLLPLTDQTRRLLNHKTLSLLPHGASLINFARGPIIETDDLLSLLDSGHISHAVLDVFDEEPLPTHSPLWTHPQITVLPHISAPTNKQTASQIVAHNINQFLVTGEIPASVNRTLGY